MAAVSRMITIINIDTQCSIEEQNTGSAGGAAIAIPSMHGHMHNVCCVCMCVCVH